MHPYPQMDGRTRFAFKAPLQYNAGKSYAYFDDRFICDNVNPCAYDTHAQAEAHIVSHHFCLREQETQRQKQRQQQQQQQQQQST